MPQQSLKDKTIKGTMWSAIDNVAQFGVQFIVSIVLARLLSPGDYGLIGIITIFTTVCTAIINGGFSNALIRTQKPTDEDYNTAFICNLLVSILLYAIVFLCSPLIADFFNRQELVALTRVSSFTMIIGALAIVQQTRLTKRIDFKTQTKITLIASILSGIVGIALALMDFGVWALVVQGIVAQSLRTVLLWFFNHWIPSIRFSKESFNRLFGFGWKMMASGILDSLWTQLYQVIVGKFYSPATLGQYTRAKQFSTMFSSNLTTVIQRVTYPVLSDIQNEKERMVAAYRKIIKTTMFLTFALMFALGAVSEPLLYCLIGPKWHEAATYLPLICLVGSLYPLHAINLNMLQVQGRSDLFLGLEIAKKIIGLAPLFVGAFVGIFPMLYTIVITGIISYFLNSYFSGKLLGYSSWMQLRDIAPSFFISLTMALVVYCLKFLPISNWVILPIQIVVGIIVFFFLCKITKIEEYKEVINMIRPILNKIKR
ncbi:MAG: lipopolysaccharide biosynthesis protein [Bacteroidales bacterium]|nr:lipopolysaccharide biosynthesis protein [Bacteroidales bacterium]